LSGERRADKQWTGVRIAGSFWWNEWETMIVEELAKDLVMHSNVSWIVLDIETQAPSGIGCGPWGKRQTNNSPNDFIHHDVREGCYVESLSRESRCKPWPTVFLRRRGCSGKPAHYRALHEGRV